MIFATCLHWLKSLQSPSDIYDSLRPMFFICSFSGFSFFRIVGYGDERRLKLCFVWVIYVAILMVFYCFEFGIHAKIIKRNQLPTDKFPLLNILANQNEINLTDKAPKFLKNIENLSCNVFVGLAMVLCLIKRNALRTALSSVCAIDRKLVQMGVKIDYKKISRCTVLLVLPICCAYLVIPSLYDRFFNKNCVTVECILFHSHHLIRSFMKFKFVVIMWHIRKRFEYIEQLLRTIPDDFAPVYSSQNRKQQHPIVAELCRMHKELCDVFYCAQNYFSHQMLIMVAVDFFYLMHNSYFIIDVFYNNNQVFNNPLRAKELVPGSVYYWLLAFGSIYFMIKAADDIRNEVAKIQFPIGPISERSLAY